MSVPSETCPLCWCWWMYCHCGDPVDPLYAPLRHSDAAVPPVRSDDYTKAAEAT